MDFLETIKEEGIEQPETRPFWNSLAYDYDPRSDDQPTKEQLLILLSYYRPMEKLQGGQDWLELMYYALFKPDGDDSIKSPNSDIFQFQGQPKVSRGNASEVLHIVLFISRMLRVVPYIAFAIFLSQFDDKKGDSVTATVNQLVITTPSTLQSADAYERMRNEMLKAVGATRSIDEVPTDDDTYSEIFDKYVAKMGSLAVTNEEILRSISPTGAMTSIQTYANTYHLLDWQAMRVYLELREASYANETERLLKERIVKKKQKTEEEKTEEEKKEEQQQKEEQQKKEAQQKREDDKFYSKEAIVKRSNTEQSDRMSALKSFIGLTTSWDPIEWQQQHEQTMAENDRKKRGATSLQRFTRRYLVRNKLSTLRDERTANTSAARIQRFTRGHLARNTLSTLKRERDTENSTATRIQQFRRKYTAKMQLDALKRAKLQELERQQQLLHEEEKKRLQEEKRRSDLLKDLLKKKMMKIEEEKMRQNEHARSVKLHDFQERSYSARQSARGQPIQRGTRAAYQQAVAKRTAQMEAERAKLEELQHLLQEATANSAIDREKFLKKEQDLASQIQTLKEEHAAALTSQQSEHAAALTRQQEVLTRQQEVLTRQQEEYAAALTRQREEHSGVLTRQQSEHAAALTRQQEALTLKQEALIRQQEALTRQREATGRQRMMREQEEQAWREKEKLLRNKTNFEKTLAHIGPAVLARKLDEQAAKIDKTKAKLATTKGALKEQEDKLAETKGALTKVADHQKEQVASIKQIQEAQDRTRGELKSKTGRLRKAAAIAALATGAAMTRHATTPNGGPLGIVERHSRSVPYNTSFYGDDTRFLPVPAGNSSFYGDTTSVPMGERKSNFSALYTGDTDFSTHVPFTSDYSVPTTETTDYSVPTTEYSAHVPPTDFSTHAHVPWQQRLQSLDPSHYGPAPDIPEQSKEGISVPSSQEVATGISVPSSQGAVATGISVPSEAKAAEAKTYEQLYIPPSKYTFFTDFDYDNPSEYILVKGDGGRRAEFFKIRGTLDGKTTYVSIRDKMHSVEIDKKDKTRTLSTASIAEQVNFGFISGGQWRKWPITKKSDIVSVNPTIKYMGENYRVTNISPGQLQYDSSSAQILLQNFNFDNEIVARYKKKADTIYKVILESSGGSGRRRTRRNKRTRRRRTRSV